MTLLLFLLNRCDWENPSRADVKGSATHYFDTLKNNIYYSNLDSAARMKYLIKISNGEYSNAKDVDYWLSVRLPQLGKIPEEDKVIAKLRITLDSTRSNSHRYKLYKTLGGIFLSENKNTVAAEFFRSALRSAERLNNPEMQLSALTGIAKTHVNLLQYDSAVYVFEEAEKLASLNNDLQNQLPDLYNGIAACHNYLGNYLVAINKFVDAAKLYQANGDTAKLGMVYHNIGTSFLYLKRYEKAIDYFNKSLAINQNTQKKQSSLIDFVNLGIAYEYMDSFAKAASCHKQGLALAKDIGDEKQVARTYLNLGNLCLKTSKYQQASTFFDSTEFYCHRNNIAYGLMLLDISRSELYLKIGQHDAALKAGNAALQKLSAFNMPYETAVLFRLLSDIHKSAGNPDRALGYLEKHVALNDSLVNLESLDIIAAYETQYEQEKKARQISDMDKVITRQQVQKKLGMFGLASIFLILVMVTVLFLQEKRKSKIKAELESQKYANLNEISTAKGRELTAKALMIAAMSDKLQIIKESLYQAQPHYKTPAQQPIKDLIRFIEQDNSTDVWDEFEENLTQINSELYKKLLLIDPKLSPMELKICGLIAQNQSTKEIAILTNRGRQTIDNVRYALRKKLNLKQDDNLSAFIRAL